MTGAQFRKLALSFADTTERPHFDRAAFRTPKRIFATLAADEATANLMLDAESQATLIEARPDAFHAVPGGWGARGATTMILAALSVADARRALVDAHALALSPAKKPR